MTADVQLTLYARASASHMPAAQCCSFSLSVDSATRIQERHCADKWCSGLGLQRGLSSHRGLPASQLPCTTLSSDCVHWRSDWSEFR